MTLWFKACCMAALAMAHLPAGADSLAPKSAQALEGRWWLFAEGAPGQGCALQLLAGGRLEYPSSGCGAQWLGKAPTGWMTKPDGLALLSEERRTLLVLNPHSADHYRGRTRGGAVLWLTKGQALAKPAGK